ncbi:MAG TPA: 23S rRNA (guanosine(2251)-2'-O)-methyltransferase RlmB [Vicinamibacterales bacterium]|jgi:23S rRNA (guanosine2251-2'-O)-methyltransferase|nr:23S rRNA (guanosine(2251)-2'-O)-methyltransferase RlmB [Vicinamibacterales bacterium]
MLLYGINPVLEALKARRVTRLRVSARSDKRIEEVLARAAKQGINVERVDAQVLDRVAKGGGHQGVVADVDEGRELTVEDLVRVSEAAAVPAFVVVLDSIEDPHNVGAILRTCNATGVNGVIRQERHSAALDGVVGKVSAGALAHARIATVVNIARAIEELKAANVWTIGLAGDAPDLYTDVDWTPPSAIVLGAEGTGLRRLVAERCDRLVRIPMLGAVDSLNVSVAAGVVLYEVVRQRGGRTAAHAERP